MTGKTGKLLTNNQQLYNSPQRFDKYAVSGQWLSCVVKIYEE